MKKLFLSLMLAVMLPLMANAQGWPDDYDGVMLQGFSWDNYIDTQWTNLEKQADELSQYFDLIWVPQSGYCNNDWNVMGYLPVYWFDHKSSFGTEAELRSMIRTFKEKGTGIIADVVFNHHDSGNEDRLLFPEETYKGVTYQLKSTDITANDDGGETKKWATEHGYQLSSRSETDEDFNGGRDLDHYSANVQKICEAYVDFMINDLGYTGFRYDMVNGFPAQFVGQYNSKGNVQYSVGEKWRGDGDIRAWIDGTKVNGTTWSAAFDFQFRYATRDALNSNNWSKLGNTGTSLVRYTANGAFPYKRYAVTFVENHDMQDRGNVDNYTADPVKKDTLAVNAFLLAMPGTPCVFLPHWKAYKQEIKLMIEARKLAGIKNTSNTQTFRTSTQYFATRTTGDNCQLLCAVGNTKNFSAPAETQFVKILDGYHYQYYMQPSREIAWADKASGTYSSSFDVKLIAVSANSGAKLVYTLDGSTPTASSTQVASKASISITQDCTLKVGLLVNGSVTNVCTREFKIVPFVPHTATVYLKAPDFSPVYFYAWDWKGVNILGLWDEAMTTPVTTTKTINGDLFYYHTFDIPEEGYFFNIIFGEGKGKTQSRDIGPIDHDVFYEITGMSGSKYSVTDITAQYEGGSETKYGDVNGDGIVNVTDVNLLVSAVLTHTTPAGYDVNGDGQINVTDINLVVSVILSSH